MTRTSHAYWAKTPAEAASLQALGWKVARTQLRHHSQWALLLVWEGEGEPPMKESDAQ